MGYVAVYDKLPPDPRYKDGSIPLHTAIGRFANRAYIARKMVRVPGLAPGFGLFLILIFFEAKPEEVEGAVGAAFADRIPRARPGREVEHLRERVLRVRDAHEDQAYGFLLRPAAGACYSRDGEPVVGAGDLAGALGHRACDGIGDGAVLQEQGVRYPEQAFLGLVGVGDDAFREVRRRSWHVRQALGEEAARAALGEGQGGAFFLEQARDRTFEGLVVFAEEVVAEAVDYFFFDRRYLLLRLLFCVGAGRDP